MSNGSASGTAAAVSSCDSDGVGPGASDIQGTVSTDYGSPVAPRIGASTGCR